MNIRDDDTDTGAIQSSGTRAWITLMSTGMCHENEHHKRATGTGKSSQIANLHFTFCGLKFAYGHLNYPM